MQEAAFGEMIRDLRIERGMTQEELADGICSASSLSKIENGGQVPTRATFQRLMERLGEPGFSYGQYYATAADYQWERIKNELLEALEGWEEAAAEEKLWRLRQMTTDKDAHRWQFYKMAELLWQQLNGLTHEDDVERCIEILRITRPEYRDLRRILEMNPDYTEMLVCNNLALGYLWDKNPRCALQILSQMFVLCRRHAYSSPLYWKQRAALCNNLAVCYLQLQRFAAAKDFCERGMQSLQKCGGIMSSLQLLRTRMELFRYLGDADRYYRQQQFLKKVYAMAQTEALKEMTPEEFLQLPQGIRVL